MDCRDVTEWTVDRLAGELSQGRLAELERHLASCEACRDAARDLEASWERLVDDPDPRVSAEFRGRTLALLEEATLARRVRSLADFKGRGVHARGSSGRATALPDWVSRVAAVLAAGLLGWSLARATGTTTEVAASPAKVRFAVESERTLDAARTMPDLSAQPRLQNVAFRPADEGGRIGVSFDVTTRYTVVGRPEEKGIAEVLAYLVSGQAAAEGVRGAAIDVVSQSYSQAASSASAQIVGVLAATLRDDKNPGVRRKAAEALAQLPPSVEARDALLAALATDPNPAIRMVAVEGLAKAATLLKDPKTIETLRVKAVDQKESGFVRGQAAEALARLSM
jgi:anti-sigma factor RsiW